MSDPAYSIPSAPEAEAHILSILAQWPDETRPMLAEENLAEDWFHLPGHRALHRLITTELDASRRVDFVTLSTRARDLAITDTLSLETGQATHHAASALSHLFMLAASGAALPVYLDELREKYVARTLQRSCAETIRAISDNWQTAGLPLVRQLHSSLTELASYGIRNETIRQIYPYVFEAVEKVQLAFNSRGHAIGLPTGLAVFDRTINGIKKGHTYYIAGRPGAGKSALLGDLANFIATNPDPYARAHSLVFSVEMTGLQFVQRELMKTAGISQQRVRDGLMSEARDFPKLTAAATTLAPARMHIDDTSALSIDDLCTRTRKFVRKLRASETPEQTERRKKSDRPDTVVFVDYLQRLHGSSKRSKDNRYLEIAEICQGISSLAKELEIAIVNAAQLGRDKNEGAENFPSLSDLRESGDIEAEAHVVIGIHRPIYYLKGDKKKEAWCEKHSSPEFSWTIGDSGTGCYGERDLTHLAYLCVLKQREGAVGEFMVHFEPALTKFQNWNPEETTYSTNTARQQTDPGGHSEEEES
jgi:replicative DNA helicase